MESKEKERTPLEKLYLCFLAERDLYRTEKGRINLFNAKLVEMKCLLRRRDIPLNNAIIAYIDNLINGGDMTEPDPQYIESVFKYQRTIISAMQSVIDDDKAKMRKNITIVTVSTLAFIAACYYTIK